MNLPRATAVLATGSWDASVAADRISLDYDERHRRRFRYRAQGGTEFLLDLPRATVLQQGEGLALDDGRIVAVDAAPEALTLVTAADAASLIRLAWHIGNRHLPAQLMADRILIREDQVITEMLRGLGATVQAIRAPFSPEAGAYANHTGAHPFVFAPQGQGHGH